MLLIFLEESPSHVCQDSEDDLLECITSENTRTIQESTNQKENQLDAQPDQEVLDGAGDGVPEIADNLQDGQDIDPNKNTAQADKKAFYIN